MQRPALSLAAVPSRRLRTIELAREIEDRGFSGIYGPSLGDSLGLCTALAQATTEIPFGTSIVNMYSRNVVDYAATASFIHELSGGRFRFGVGVSHAPMNKRLGVHPGKPLGDMRQFVADLREQPRNGDLPPIVLAAMRDKMLTLAGEIAEGAVYANACRSAVADQLARVPAPSIGDDFFVGCMIPTTISDDRAAAAAVNRKTMRMYCGLPNYRNYWKQAGYADEMAAIEAALEAGDRDAVPGLMSDEWLADITLFGTRDEVLSGVQEWLDAGVTPILVPSSTEGGQLQAFDEIFSAFDSV